jgi:PAS domain S-box-containing protein
MIRKKRSASLDTIKLSHPQKAAVARVLTAQKNKYKKLLHEAHERLHIIADMTTSLEFWYNVNGSYEFVSPSSQEILGYAPAEFLGGKVDLEQLIHPDSIDRFLRDRSMALEGGADKGIEYQLHTREQETIWVEASWQPVMTRKGKHIGIRISIRDITEFKRCQSYSRAYQQLTLTIADDLHEVGIFSLTPDWEIISWNSGANALFGWEKAEMIGSSFASLLPDEDEGATLAVMEGMSCGDKRSLTIHLRCKDGESCKVTVLFLALCNHNGQKHQVTCLLRPAP